jgi:type 1 fimbria pilin
MMSIMGTKIFSILFCLSGLLVSVSTVAACGTVGPAVTMTSPSSSLATAPRDSVVYPFVLGNNWSPSVSQLLYASGCAPSWTSWVVPLDAATGMTITTSTPRNSGAQTFPIYPTGVANIGYIIQVWDPSTTNGITGPLSGDTETKANNTSSPQGSLAIVAFVQTGPLEAGTYSIPGKSVANTYESGSGSSNDRMTGPGVIAYSSTTITVQSTSCTVDVGSVNQAIILPTITTSSLNSLSSVAGATPFSLSVSNCSVGIKLYATMTDANAPTSANQYLLNTGSASGAGVQILNSLGAVTFGVDSSVAGNPGQWYIGTGATSYTIPMTAQYLSIGTIKPGSVNARATMTFSYQ